jgi:hypothetical protein
MVEFCFVHIRVRSRDAWIGVTFIVTAPQRQKRHGAMKLDRHHLGSPGALKPGHWFVGQD